MDTDSPARRGLRFLPGKEVNDRWWAVIGIAVAIVVMAVIGAIRWKDMED